MKRLFGRRKRTRQDRNEDDVVDAEHHLEHGQRRQTNQGVSGEQVRHARRVEGATRAASPGWRRRASGN
jgi:hypothetical protein